MRENWAGMSPSEMEQEESDIEKRKIRKRENDCYWLNGDKAPDHTEEIGSRAWKEQVMFCIKMKKAVLELNTTFIQQIF